jgi:tetratricopeptide (TPR) repeat protein
MVRGQTAVKMAQSPSDYEDAVKEFQEAVRLAPDWAAAWYNLGLVQEKAGKPGDAAASLKRFLELAPDDPDAEQVKNLVYELEFKAERARKDEDRRNSLIGTWDRYDTETGEKYNAYEIRAKGTGLEVRLRDMLGELVVPLEFDGKNVKFKYLYRTAAYQVEYTIQAALESGGVLRGTMDNEVISAQPNFPTRPGHKGSVSTELRKR